MHNIFKAEDRVSVCSPPHYHSISHPLLLAPSFPVLSAPKLWYLQTNHCTLIKYTGIKGIFTVTKRPHLESVQLGDVCVSLLPHGTSLLC